jgi:hypothetical protein
MRRRAASSRAPLCPAGYWAGAFGITAAAGASGWADGWPGWFGWAYMTMTGLGLAWAIWRM